MTDLHTHILPGMDDGAADVKTSLAMLRAERSQGVDAVVLTPHFYRDRERPKWFLERRKEAGERLAHSLLELPEEEVREEIPQLILGAEVAWGPNLADWDYLPELCIGDTRNFLLELPFMPWTDGVIDQLYEVMNRTGLTPIIAHLERYVRIQRPDHIREILNMGVPIQFSAACLQHPLRRGSYLKMIGRSNANFVASDCHNTSQRPPNVESGMRIIEKKLGQEKVRSMDRLTDQLAGL